MFVEKQLSSALHHSFYFWLWQIDANSIQIFRCSICLETFHRIFNRSAPQSAFLFLTRVLSGECADLATSPSSFYIVLFAVLLKVQKRISTVFRCFLFFSFWFLHFALSLRRCWYLSHGNFCLVCDGGVFGSEITSTHLAQFEREEKKAYGEMAKPLTLYTWNGISSHRALTTIPLQFNSHRPLPRPQKLKSLQNIYLLT